MIVEIKDLIEELEDLEDYVSDIRYQIDAALEILQDSPDEEAIEEAIGKLVDAARQLDDL